MTNGKMESRGCGDDIEDAGKAAEVAAFEKRERMGLASSIKPGTDADAASRAARRSMRERLNDRDSRRLLVGVLATLFGGIFWGFSGTSASYLFAHYQIDTIWLLSIRQLLAGAMFMVVILLFDRVRFVQLLKNPRHLAVMAVFTLFGVFGNSFSYLLAVRLTNAGTATVMQCLQLVLIMVYTCIVTRRLPRRRELAGVVLAFAGAFLIATGGDPSTLVIPPEGLAVGLISAVGAACMSIVPAKILPVYGSSIVTGTAMFASGIVLSAFVQPWQSIPAFDPEAGSRLPCLSWLGLSWRTTCICRALRILEACGRVSSVRLSRCPPRSRARLFWVPSSHPRIWSVLPSSS